MGTKKSEVKKVHENKSVVKREKFQIPSADSFEDPEKLLRFLVDQLEFRVQREYGRKRANRNELDHRKDLANFQRQEEYIKIARKMNGRISGFREIMKFIKTMLGEEVVYLDMVCPECKKSYKVLQDHVAEKKCRFCDKALKISRE